jgi:Ca2+-binding RTX toxin-like protein
MIKELILFRKKIKTMSQAATIPRTVALLIIILLTGTTTVGIVSVWAANLFGTSGPDTLVGTDDDDNIYGLGGNDKITDGLGSDKVFAGSGHDRIKVEGTTSEEAEEGVGTDEVYGEKGRDNIDGVFSVGFLVIYGGDDGDTIRTGGDQNDGKMYGGTGNDFISTCCDAHYDVWGGPGNDEIQGSSECSIDRAFGESGNDRILQPLFGSGGPGNDIIEFTDCSGVAYGDSGDDELRGLDVGSSLELHGGSEDDILNGAGDDDELFGDDGDDTLEGEEGADFFSCGTGIDTITDFNAAEGDTKTADCENF